MGDVYRHPLFFAGLVLRLLLIAAVHPYAVEHWYAPFIAHSVSHFDLDPWSSFLAAGGDRLAFPYGYAMWLLFLPLGACTALLGLPSAVGYTLTLLVADFAMLHTLHRLVSCKVRTLLLLYWLSPIVLFATYWLGFNDIVPILLLGMGLAALRAALPRQSGVLVALAISAKLSMLLAAPFLLIYLFHNRRLRLFFMPFATALGVALLALQLPYILSSGAREMLFGNPELSKTYDISFAVGSSLRVYLLPLVYFLALFGAWRMKRMNFELLIALLGIAFFCVLLLSPAAPGWFVWVIPFLVVYQARSGRTAMSLVGIFSLLYIGLTALMTRLPALPIAGWPAGIVASTQLALPDRTLSLWHTLLIGLGLIVVARMLREGVQSNEYFRLSRKPFAIGIAGDSGSGKDTLAEAVTGIFGAHSVVHVSGDDYHRWDRQKPMWQVMTHLNPRANELAQFTHDVQAFANGQTVAARHYDHATGRMSAVRRLASNHFIVVSGLHALYPSALRALYGLSIFMDMDEDLRRYLKMRRDVTERGASVEKVRNALERRAPDAGRFIQPQAQFADLILSLQPIHMPDLADTKSALRLKLCVRARHGVGYDELVRILIGVCGLHVDMEVTGADGSVSLTIEGETSGEDIALAFARLSPELAELVDLQPQWRDGMLGIMQLIVLTHSAEALRGRLV